MDANTSSSQNSSQTPSSCFSSPPGSSIFAVFTVTNVLLLLPLSTFILGFGFLRWRKQRPAAMNPLDVFTFHMVVMELFGMSSSVTCFCGAYKNHQNMVKVGCNMFAITSCVKMFFHVLTCMERYMAVVHPLTYRNLSKSGGVMIRNICVGFVWFLLAGLIALRLQMGNNFNMILFFCNLVLSLIVSSFCNISVVRVLNRAGPGEEGANAGKTDKLKQKALVTITAIMTVLLLRFSGNLICLSLGSSQVLSSYDTCVVLTSGVWFCLPSGYVLPLLFLHRAEKLPCLKYNKKQAPTLWNDLPLHIRQASTLWNDLHIRQAPTLWNDLPLHIRQVQVGDGMHDSQPYFTFGINCYVVMPGFFQFISYGITFIFLLLPLCIFVLYLGLQRWRQQSSTSSTASTNSHSDIFTFHMVVMELLCFLGFNLCVYAVYVENYKIFHILTCVERYLAVVHPVTYLNLKGQRGVRIRNLHWVFAIPNLPPDLTLVFDLGLMIFTLIVVSFFSLAVLCVLIRPGPGEQGGDRTIVDQSKRRAFFTIVAILGVLLFRCFVGLVRAVFELSDQPEDCVLMAAEVWFTLPSNMALNSSSFNDSPFYPNLLWDMECLISRPGYLILLSFYITSTLLILPICIFVLYLGLQRWRQRSSTSSTTCHSDIFTFHMVLMELVDYSGFTLVILECNQCRVHYNVLPWYGRAYFHVLTCVEHYLAVVHPVTYLSLKGQRGVRIRNICIGFLRSNNSAFLDQNVFFFDLCLLIISLIVVCFCSLSVLHVLIRPGPGEQGGDRTIVDQSKRRAFYTIVAILGVLLFRSCGNMALVVPTVFNEGICVMVVSDSWFSLPSSLVLPLLFLHRAGKLSVARKTPKEDKDSIRLADMALDSPSSNDSLLHQRLPMEMECLISRPGSLVFLSFYITSTLLILPICIFVLYLGFQRWRQQSSTSSTSHSDIFTFHMVLMELVDYSGFTLYMYGLYTVHVIIYRVGYFVLNSFHVLTCVERYLAVVHPVTYMNLKGERGVRIRNICIGCVWMIFIAVTPLNVEKPLFYFDLSLTIISLGIVFFCSMSVLCVLIRPGPGEQGGDRKIVDQSKRRAFFTIVAILAVMLVNCCANLMWFVSAVSGETICEMASGVTSAVSAQGRKINLLLLNLYLSLHHQNPRPPPSLHLVLYLGLQRCRQRSSTSAAASTNSHSDIFTFHMVVFELWYFLGRTLFTYAIYSANHKIFGVGSYICLITRYGRNSCHVLTCVERYLAVVHPVTYLNLKGQRGVRIRNICIGFVWLLCLVAIIPLSLQKDVLFFHLSLMIFSLMVVAFCSLAVLRELIRPGPGEQGGDRRELTNQSAGLFTP
ncbi:hypothetical protein F7725_004926 [Dissostichus mawsoni]|uniref:G-protein coupled receptors family 1 profile domain-containing protein n=1 Tax=Dissostichus mawsoni TaxID=36200 RepID=A0A7J5XK54_DISMA|nr:hypothetical protein F7725_004926 [Dissostichus mawsoni]